MPYAEQRIYLINRFKEIKREVSKELEQSHPNLTALKNMKKSSGASAIGLAIEQFKRETGREPSLNYVQERGASVDKIAVQEQFDDIKRINQIAETKGDGLTATDRLLGRTPKKVGRR